MDKLTLIIPSAGLGRRMKSYGPKPLIDLGNGQLVLERQLSILKQAYPDAEFVLVLGFEAEKVYRVIPKYVKVIENGIYDITNVAKSIEMAINATNPSRLLIVYGDLVFNQQTFESMPLNESLIVVDNKQQLHETEVGVHIENNKVCFFSYHAPTKWAQIAYLTGKELHEYKKIAGHPDRKRFYSFEIFNLIISHGGQFTAFEPPHMRITEIDTAKDIDTARDFIKEIK